MPLSQRLFATLILVLVPIAAAAQGTILGVVKDASGAVLPGVSVEATSSVLRNRVEVVTDSLGAFRIANLPTGTYILTFLLSGFDIPSLKDVAVRQDATVVTAIAGLDDGCGGSYRVAGPCRTYRQVATDVPPAFRSLWGAGIRDVSAVQSGFPCETISLKRSGGLVFLPGHNYTVSLSRDGGAELKSRDTPDRDTDYAGDVAFWDYGKLCYLTQRLGFEHLARLYSANWTDAGGVTITVTSQGREVVVSEYAGIGPIEFWALTNAIEAIKDRIEWKAK